MLIPQYRNKHTPSLSMVHPHACSLYWIENGEELFVGQEDMSPADLRAEFLRLLLVKGGKGPKAQEAAYRVSRGEDINPFDQISDITLPLGTSIAVVRALDRRGQSTKHIPKERDIPTFRHIMSWFRGSSIGMRSGLHRPLPCLIDKISLEGNPAIPLLSVHRGTMINAFQNVQSLSCSRPHPGSRHVLGITIRSLPDDDEVPAFLRSTHHEDTWEELESAWNKRDEDQWKGPDTESSAGGGWASMSAPAAPEESQGS